MPALTPPKLDDRRYQELRDELIRRIPVHSAQWTDHNVSDPGIVLLELFAFLGENLLYRINRIPEKAQREFLNLLNIPLKSAQVANALVKFELPKGRTEPINIPFGGLHGRTGVAASGDVEFQVIDELTVLPVEARAYIKRAISELPEDTIGIEGVAQLLEDHLDGSESNNQEKKAQLNKDYYETLMLESPEGGILPPATSLAQAVDRSLWIALLAPKPLVKGLENAGLEERLKQLRLNLSGKAVSFGVRVDDTLCGAQDHMRCPWPGADSPSRYPILWQVATGRFSPQDKRKVDAIVYSQVKVRKDDTAELTSPGVVRILLPASGPGGTLRFGTWTADDLGDPDLLGIGELPPRLDEPEDESRVLTWIRALRIDPEHPTPRVHHIDSNMVEVEQAITAAGELLGFGNERSDQAVGLAHSPVLIDSAVVQIREAGDWQTWRVTEHLSLSQPDDRHYEIDLAKGEIRFGDGIHGRIPRPGEAIRCLSYRYGGGVRGNVPAGAIKRVKASGIVGTLKCENIFPAAGGVDAETETEGIDRIPQVLRHRERAVAADDFRDIAMETPAVKLGRVEVLPRHKPHERIDGVPGVVTLIIVPAYDPIHPDEPVPDRDTQRRVCMHLETRRLLTTELYVTPPEYVPVWISTAIAVEPGYGVETVENWVDLAIRQYMAPLPPYGPAGKGWPFGRAVRKRDIEASILRVEGVRLVNQVALEGTEISANGTLQDVTDKIELGSWQLPVVRRVQVVTERLKAAPIVREDQPVGEDRPDGEGMGIPIPVEREEC